MVYIWFCKPNLSLSLIFDLPPTLFLGDRLISFSYGSTWSKYWSAALLKIIECTLRLCTKLTQIKLDCSWILKIIVAYSSSEGLEISQRQKKANCTESPSRKQFYGRTRFEKILYNRQILSQKLLKLSFDTNSFEIADLE